MPTIKRYANRKLYDLDERRYVTLDDIAQMIRAGETVRVIDHETEADLTPLIQAQIISTEERKVKRGLPTAVLTNIIQAGSNRLQWLHGERAADALNARVDAEIERRIGLLIERGDLKKATGERLLQKLLAVNAKVETETAATPEMDGALGRLGIASRSDVTALERQVETLSAELARINRRRSKRTK